MVHFDKLIFIFVLPYLILFLTVDFHKLLILKLAKLKLYHIYKIKCLSVGSPKDCVIFEHLNISYLYKLVYLNILSSF